jgi:hypothetical protein
MYFDTKNYLKSIHNHTIKHTSNGLDKVPPPITQQPYFYPV